MQSPWRTTTEPSACRAILPVSIEISCPLADTSDTDMGFGVIHQVLMLLK
jgi:hypothetical protein